MNQHSPNAPAIRKRRVIYIPGYDLRRPEAPFAQLEEELAGFQSIRSVQCRFSKFRSGLGAGGASAEWTGDAIWPEGKVSTSFTLLGWRDLIKRDFQRPSWAVLLAACRTFFLFALAGGYSRGLRANWANGLFFLYPAALLFLFALIAIVPVLFLPSVLTGNGYWVAGGSLAAGVIWAMVLYRVSRLIERKSYFWYLLRDWISIGRLARNEDPPMAARIQEFADRIIEVAADCDAGEELVITAHSSGTFVLMYALEQVLKRVPDFGATHGRVTVLTMGSAFGYVGGFGAEHGFGAAVARVAQAKHLDWTDVYGPHDILCCGRTSPVATYALALKSRAREPRRFSVRIPDRMTAERYRQTRYRFFDLHFCYFFASTRQNLFDFYRLTLGPLPAVQQLREWDGMSDELTGFMAQASSGK